MTLLQNKQKSFSNLIKTKPVKNYNIPLDEKNSKLFRSSNLNIPIQSRRKSEPMILQKSNITRSELINISKSVLKTTTRKIPDKDSPPPLWYEPQNGIVRISEDERIERDLPFLYETLSKGHQPSIKQKAKLPDWITSIPTTSPS